MQNNSYKKGLLVVNEDKKIKKIYFDRTKRFNILQDPYFVYDRSSLVKPTFITEINKFLPIYFLISNLSEEKQGKSKIISSVNQKSFTMEKTVGKIETMKKKVYNLQLTWIGTKRKREVEVIEFISMHGQQGFEEEAEINPIELKIESDKIQDILEKKKYVAISRLEDLLFSSSMKHYTGKIFLTTNNQCKI